MLGSAGSQSHAPQHTTQDALNAREQENYEGGMGGNQDDVSWCRSRQGGECIEVVGII